MQYADFAAQQRDWLHDAVVDGQLAFWVERLRGLEPVELPTDRPRQAARSGRGAVLAFPVPAGLSGRLRSVFGQHQVTPFMGFLAVFTIQLANYTGQDDLAVGTPVAGRNRAEVEDLVGFFVNTLVMRTDLSGDPTLAQLWERTREQALDAYAHQDLPFERMVEQLSPDRDLSRTPLFQHMFAFQNAASHDWELPGLRIEAEPLGSTVAKFDLTLDIEESAAGYQAAFSYSTDLFDHATIERMAGHFLTLLQAAAEDPGRPVSQLPMLTGDELRLLLTTWNDTAAPYPDGQCVHELITRQAAQHPGRTAVSSGGQNMSYQELDERSNQFARWLIDAGAGPEVLVGICAERGIDMIIGLLAILKAGGAYVPLDPDCPRDRLEYMLADTAAPVIVTQQALAARIPAAPGRTILCLDAATPDAYPATSPGSAPPPDNLAYIIYTSGSTGKPKGVLDPAPRHRQLHHVRRP